MVQIEGVEKKFGDRPVLRGVSLEISDGDLVALIGPSGCGKSTLLRCINGLEVMDAGAIHVGGVTLLGRAGADEAQRRLASQKIRQTVGMVFQSFNLFPHLTVLENLMIAPTVVKARSKSETESAARVLLKKVGLSTHADHYPSELSGGQQQRAAIARSLAMSPHLMLYDEPTSALDPTLVHEVFQVMKQLDNEGMTQIVVTHDMRFARDFADRVIFIESGVIVEHGSPDDIFVRPQDERTKSFLRHFL